MRIRIRDQVYPMVGYQNADLLHLIELQQQGRDLVDGGLGMSALTRMHRELAAYQRAAKAHQDAADQGQESTEPDVPDCGPISMGITVFLTLRKAGQVVSLRDALRVAPDQIEQMPDPTDPPATQEGGEDPTAPGSGGPATPGAAAPDLVRE